MLCGAYNLDGAETFCIKPESKIEIVVGDGVSQAIQSPVLPPNALGQIMGVPKVSFNWSMLTVPKEVRVSIQDGKGGRSWEGILLFTPGSLCLNDVEY